LTHRTLDVQDLLGPDVLVCAHGLGLGSAFAVDLGTGAAKEGNKLRPRQQARRRAFRKRFLHHIPNALDVIVIWSPFRVAASQVKASCGDELLIVPSPDAPLL